ncbi:MAG: tRNA (guanosine(46)-N7)-methyltransferase TrmB [Bacteroidota bacterium]
MAKKKLLRFNELRDFSNVFQPHFREILNNDFYLKGKWSDEYFKNSNPVILELACGKGEYTTKLAELYPEKNFLGIDIKGARIFIGAKYALLNNINNIGFIRIAIEGLNAFFNKNEINEIWITFPDPQMKISRTLKRLTSSRFLNIYSKFLINNGIIHLKTDNDLLYKYTQAIIETNHIKVLQQTDDLYAEKNIDKILKIQTYYEKKFLSVGKNINYIKFCLPSGMSFSEPAEKFGIIYGVG